VIGKSSGHRRSSGDGQAARPHGARVDPAPALPEATALSGTVSNSDCIVLSRSTIGEAGPRPPSVCWVASVVAFVMVGDFFRSPTAAQPSRVGGGYAAAAPGFRPRRATSAAIPARPAHPGRIRRLRNARSAAEPTGGIAEGCGPTYFGDELRNVWRHCRGPG